MHTALNEAVKAYEVGKAALGYVQDYLEDVRMQLEQAKTEQQDDGSSKADNKADALIELLESLNSGEGVSREKLARALALANEAKNATPKEMASG